MKSDLLEIEIDSPKNGDLFFGPLGKRIRGGYDVHRAVQHDKDAARLINEYPQPIPGQRLALNVETKQGHVIEPLHEECYAPLREKLVKKNLRLEQPQQTFANVDVPTWLHWLKASVEAGVAKVVKGAFPDKIEGTPRKSFYSADRKSESSQLTEAIDKQTAAVEKQASSFERLADTLEKLLEGLLKSKK